MTETHSDPAAERAVLSACLASSLARTEARKHITGGDFDDPAHEALWDAMSELDRAKQPVDPQTVLTSIRSNERAAKMLPDLVTRYALPDNVAEYARPVREWAVRRRVRAEAAGTMQRALNGDADATGLAAEAATRFAAIRDYGAPEEVSALSLTELLAIEDGAPDWAIPGLLERRDRFIVTGEEGLGKSHWLRQLAVCAAAGLDPFDAGRRYEPRKVVIIDCENSWAQVRRRIRAIAEFARRHGDNPADRVLVECCARMDITRDKDLARIHQLLDAAQPDIVVIGPLYRLVPRALQTDDEAAPVLAALDTLREKGAALLMEAHAGHAIGKHGVRDMRPRGSSALLGWPEFGYGMRGIGAEGYCDLVRWRGDRSERQWPQRMRRADGFRWVIHEDMRYDATGGAA